MISVYVFNQVKAIGLDQTHNFDLQLRAALSKLDSFLNHSTAIAVFRELKNACFNYTKQSLSVTLFPSFKNFLKNVISKFIFCQLNAFLN